MRSTLALVLLLGCLAEPPPKSPEPPDPPEEEPVPTAPVPAPPQEPPPSASDPLPPAEIQRIVRAGFDGMRDCYQQGLAKDPNLEGKVLVRFAIRPDGTVPGAHIESDMPPEVVACIKAEFLKLTFPPPNRLITVSYPIIFTPSG